jgi:hypothetical protein
MDNYFNFSDKHHAADRAQNDGTLRTAALNAAGNGRALTALSKDGDASRAVEGKDASAALTDGKNAGKTPGEYDAGNVSSAADEAYKKQGHNHKRFGKDGFDGTCPECECETCKNRRYQDDSDDGSVSFQNATKMKPTEAAHRVKSHEMEHVRKEQQEARSEGKQIISQSVTIQNDICPECGRVYVAGGLTRTEVKEVGGEFYELFRVGGVSENAEAEAEAEESVG